MIRPPYRPRKRHVSNPNAAELAAQGQWPYFGGTAGIKGPQIIAIDGVQIGGPRRPGLQGPLGQVAQSLEDAP